jgi:hypothetical protein
MVPCAASAGQTLSCCFSPDSGWHPRAERGTSPSVSHCDRAGARQTRGSPAISRPAFAEPDLARFITTFMTNVIRRGLPASGQGTPRLSERAQAGWPVPDGDEAPPCMRWRGLAWPCGPGCRLLGYRVPHDPHRCQASAANSGRPVVLAVPGFPPGRSPSSVVRAVLLPTRRRAQGLRAGIPRFFFHPQDICRLSPVRCSFPPAHPQPVHSLARRVPPARAAGPEPTEGAGGAPAACPSARSRRIVPSCRRPSTRREGGSAAQPAAVPTAGTG